MHCTSCGAEVPEGSKFCGKCGAPGGPSDVAGTPGPAAAPAASALQSNAAGALCYLIGFITGIFFLMVDPYRRDPFVRFHAFQAIFFSAAWVVLYFVIGLFSAVLPFGLWQVTVLLYWLLGLAFFLSWLFLMFKAYNRERFKLPVIGDLAAKQAGG